MGRKNNRGRLRRAALYPFSSPFFSRTQFTPSFPIRCAVRGRGGTGHGIIQRIPRFPIPALRIFPEVQTGMAMITGVFSEVFFKSGSRCKEREGWKA